MLKTLFSQKQTHQISLKQWLPILQQNLSELTTQLQTMALENPYMEVRSGLEVSESAQSLGKKLKLRDERFSSSSDFASQVAFQNDSLYEILEAQIDSHLFPTPLSKNIALEIANQIDENGFFEGSCDEIATLFGVSSQSVERIRLRFALLEPSGIGAKDLKECFAFQLQQLELDDELDVLLGEMIKNIDHLGDFSKRHRYEEAFGILKRFKNPPAVDFLENSTQIVPDLFVFFDGEELKIEINNQCYPDIIITDAPKQLDFTKEKLKEARQVSNLLGLRKSTLYSIALLIVEKQFRFFLGGTLMPLKFQDLADSLGFNQSTISRAISGKYLSCERGVFALKEFFTNAIGDVSSDEIKQFMVQTIQSEDIKHPLTDDQILEAVCQRFGIKMVRRSITKYRIELGIASSKERAINLTLS